MQLSWQLLRENVFAGIAFLLMYWILCCQISEQIQLWNLFTLVFSQEGFTLQFRQEERSFSWPVLRLGSCHRS